MTIKLEGDEYAKRQALLIALQLSFEANGKSMKDFDLQMPVSNRMALLQEEKANWRSQYERLTHVCIYARGSIRVPPGNHDSDWLEFVKRVNQSSNPIKNTSSCWYIARSR